LPVPDTASKLALDRLRNVVRNAADASKDGGRNLALRTLCAGAERRGPARDLRYLADAKLSDLAQTVAKAQIAAALGLLGDRTRAEPSTSRRSTISIRRRSRSWSAVRITARRCATLRRSSTLASEAGGSRPMIVNAFQGASSRPRARMSTPPRKRMPGW